MAKRKSKLNKKQGHGSKRPSTHSTYLFYLLLLAVLIAITAFVLSTELGTGKATQPATLNSKDLPSDLRITDMLVLPEGHLPPKSACWRPVDTPTLANDGYSYQTWARIAGCETD